MMTYVLKIYYIQKRIEFTSQDSAKDIVSLHGGLQNSHSDLNNVHQNEFERNSLDVDNPHCSWQIGSRLNHVPSPLPLHLDVSMAFGIATFDPCADSVRCWVVGLRRGAKYYRQ
jgi:hypothetical protein